MSDRPHIVSTKLLQSQTKALLPAWVNYSEVAAIEQELAVGELISMRFNEWASSQVLVVFSSISAIEAIHPLFKSWPFHWRVAFVGEKTKKKFTELFAQAQVVSTALSAHELATVLVENQEPCDVIYCCGNRHLHHLPVSLRKAGFAVTELIVYNTLLKEFTLPAPADALLFFSPSAVESFTSQHAISYSTLCIASGATTAGALSAHINTAQLLVSEAPGQEAVLRTCLAALQQNFQVSATDIIHEKH